MVHYSHNCVKIIQSWVPSNPSKYKYFQLPPSVYSDHSCFHPCCERPCYMISEELNENDKYSLTCMDKLSHSLKFIWSLALSFIFKVLLSYCLSHTGHNMRLSSLEFISWPFPCFTYKEFISHFAVHCRCLMPWSCTLMPPHHPQIISEPQVERR